MVKIDNEKYKQEVEQGPKPHSYMKADPSLQKKKDNVEHMNPINIPKVIAADDFLGRKVEETTVTGKPI